MKGNCPKKDKVTKSEELIAVARTDNLNLAKHYTRLLDEQGIEAVIREGDESAGFFNISILVGKMLYDEAYLFIETENGCESYYLDSMLEPPHIRRQTG